MNVEFFYFTLLLFIVFFTDDCYEMYQDILYMCTAIVTS